MAVSTSCAEAMPIIAISQPRLAIMAHMRWAMKPGESLITVTLVPDLANSATAASRTAASAPGAVMTVRRLPVLPVRSTATVRLGSSSSSIAVVVQSLPIGATGIDLGALGIVGVPAAAGLAAELARGVQALVIGAGRHAPVVEEALVDDLARREVHVDAGQVHQLERPHAKAAGVAHYGVDLARARPALLEDAQALGADRRSAEIDQEARRVADDDGDARLALA